MALVVSWLLLAGSAVAADGGRDAGSPADAAPADPSAGDGALDGGVTDRAPPAPEPQDAGPALPDADTTPPLPTARLDGETPIPELRTQIAALTPLAEGQAPAGRTVTSLFAVDLRDEAAVAGRIDELRRAVDVARHELDPLVARRTAAQGGAASALTAEEADRLERLELLVAREGLRLAVLSRPLAERQGLVAAEEAMHRAASEQAAAQAAQQAAEAVARTAEQARQTALLEAENARSEAERQLATARAGAEAVRAAVADAQALLARDRATRAESAQRRTDMTHRARTALGEPGLTGAVADGLHRTLVDELVLARAELGRALDVLGAPATVPEVPSSVDLDAAAYRALPFERDAVIRTLATATTERANHVAEEHADRRAAVPAVAEEVRALNELRLALLDHLSPELHERVMGLGREGLHQLARELEHLRLMSRWYTHDRRSVAGAAPGWLVDTLGRSSTRWMLIELLAMVLIALPLITRRRRILDWFDAQIRDWALRSDTGDHVRRLWRPLRALAIPLLFYVFSEIFFGVLVELLPVPEIRLAGRVVHVLAVYLLVIAASHYILLQLASRPGTPVDEVLSARLLRTVRIAGRTAAIIAVFLIVAEVILGRGYLYTLVRQFAWIAAFPVVWFALRRWQVDIFDAYLQMVPEGSVADLARRFRTRLLGAFVALPVAAWLAARRIGQIAARWALRLEQVRRALSFLFLRRLEKQAAAPEAGTRPVSPELLAVLDQRALDDALRVERFPRLDEALADLALWRAGAPGMSWAVIGERGAGKSSWIDSLATRLPESATVLRLDRPVSTVDAMCGWLADQLGLPDCAPTVDGVVRALETGPPRLILLDDAQYCAQRAPGHTGGFAALLDIVRRTHHTAWVCTFSLFLWDWLMFATRQQDTFRNVARLDRWSEAEIGALIDRRMAVAGRTVTYEDLMERPERVFERDEELARTRERYVRLLWDYAEGLPRLVLHFWSRSLIEPGPDDAPPTDEAAPGADDAAPLPPLRVRLFDVPKPDELEGLLDPARFALHAVVLHAGLDLDDAPALLQMPPERSLAMLEQLRALGCLERRGRRYVVPIHWHRAVVRFLRRKHLFESR